MARTYPISKTVVVREELFPGFGWPEVWAVAGAFVLGLGIFFLLGLFTHSFLRFVFLIAPPGFLIMVFKRDLSGMRLFDQWLLKKRWRESKRLYLFRNMVG